jgi:hypothetical protein
MKFTSLLAAAAAGLFLSSISCERHEWEETKVLHQKHGHGASDGDKHGKEKHGEEKSHDTHGAESHGEENKAH